jgi:hypothetical protein
VFEGFFMVGDHGGDMKLTAMVKPELQWRINVWWHRWCNGHTSEERYNEYACHDDDDDYADDYGDRDCIWVLR